MAPERPEPGATNQRSSRSRATHHPRDRCVRAAITAALDAGCSLRDVQDCARHADPRQTRRCDRARGAMDRNPTYIVATYLAGATGAR
jgi:hypothetical protein